MNINFFRMLLMTFLAVAGLAACSDDMKKNPIECLLVKTEGKTLDLNK